MSQLTEMAQNLSTSRVIELMTDLGATQHIETNNAVIFPTICHNHNADDASMKLYYYPKTHTFHCYTDCGCTFNIFEMFKKRYELLGESYDFYKDIVLKIEPSPIKRKREEFVKRYETIYEQPNYDAEVHMPHINKGILNMYNFYPTPEWLNDGISEEAMRHYNILYSISDNKIIIPHYDKDNNLVGIRGRALNDEDIAIGKYMPVRIEGRTYAHPLGYNLYGLNVVKDNIKRLKMAIVAEGEKSPLQSETMFGAENNITVASCGSTLHMYQVKLLLEAGAERILIAYDNEGTTWEEREKYFQKLKSMCEKFKNYCLMGFTFDNSGLTKLKQSPFDCGKEVATKLITKGVWL